MLGLSPKMFSYKYCCLFSYKYAFNLQSVFSPRRWAFFQNMVMMKVNLSGLFVYRKLGPGEDCLSGSLVGKRKIKLMKVKERLREQTLTKDLLCRPTYSISFCWVLTFPVSSQYGPCPLPHETYLCFCSCRRTFILDFPYREMFSIILVLK